MDVKSIIRQMTLEEKAGMCSGRDFWNLKSVERLGVPSVMVTDGPHGLRKQAKEADHLGLNASVPATCFPTAAALACSFDRVLVKQVGQALGEECQAEDVTVILGPGNNIKRSPLCGRNFEYFSEDPYLSGEMAAGHIQGVQSMNVGTSLKHYAANNQEHRRMTVDARIDERTLREIYLASFETAVKKGRPWTVMCSYNKINGVYACESPFTLTEVLRDEWGFDGYVMTDWGAMDDKVQALQAGLELQMPGGNPIDDQILVDAVRSGKLSEEVLDRAVERILNITDRYIAHHLENAQYDREEHHVLARKIAGGCMVLLKNDESLLPLNTDMKIAVIGKMAVTPRYQGGGSSHIQPTMVSNALDAFREYTDISYAQGYMTERDEIDQGLFEEAVLAARSADVAVVFAGLPEAFESEGFDRSHMDMPNCQNALIQAIAEVQPNIVVVLSNGSPVTMPWLHNVKAVVEGYLGGQAGGGAAVDVLFGTVNPSGRLAETFPLKLEDNPSYLNFPGDGDLVEYREGVYVGYRYYDKKQMDVLFPFGYGLSYTQFAYGNLRLGSSDISATEELTVSVDVTNIGFVPGEEVVQLYVAPTHDGISRPIRELKGFEKIMLQPGETKTVAFQLDARAFAYYETKIHDWYVEDGAYEIQIGRSSRDIALSESITVHQSQRLPVHYSINTPIGDIMLHPIGRAFCAEIMKQMMPASQENEAPLGMEGDAFFKMMEGTPLRALIGFSGGKLPLEVVWNLIDAMNG